MNSKHNRRLFRFTTRSLLIVVTVIAICLAYHIDQVKRESRTADRLAANKCFVFEKNPDNVYQSFTIVHSGEMVRNNIPIRNSEFETSLLMRLTSYHYDHVYVTDKSKLTPNELIAELHNMPWLRSVSVDKNRYSDLERQKIAKQLKNVKIQIVDLLAVDSITPDQLIASGVKLPTKPTAPWLQSGN